MRKEGEATRVGVVWNLRFVSHVEDLEGEHEAEKSLEVLNVGHWGSFGKLSVTFRHVLLLSANLNTHTRESYV